MDFPARRFSLSRVWKLDSAIISLPHPPKNFIQSTLQKNFSIRCRVLGTRLAITSTVDELRKVDASPPFASALHWFLLQRFPCFSAYSCRFFYGGPLDRKQSAGVNNALPRAGKPYQFLACVSSPSATIKVFHRLSSISIVIELFGKIVIYR